MNLIFDVTKDLGSYEGHCVLHPKFKTFMVYGGYDKAQRWKAAGAFNAQDAAGNWHTVAKNTEILIAMSKVRGPIALDPAASARFKELNQTLIDSRADDADIDIPAPDGLTYRPFQKGGVNYAINKFKAGNVGVLFGDDMGLGKTIESLAVINAKPEISTVLVLCPASLKINWMRESVKWLTRPFNVIVGDNQPHDASLEEVIASLSKKKCKHTFSSNAEKTSNNLLILNFEIVKNWVPVLMKANFDYVIVDEIQNLKNGKAKRTQMVFGTSTDKGFQPGIFSRCKLRAGLTGTPIMNFVSEIYGIVNALQPGCLGPWKNFADQYCDRHWNGFGWDIKGAKNLDALQVKLRQKLMIRRLKKDVLKELPQKMRQVVELPANGATGIVNKQSSLWAKHEDAMDALQAALDIASVTGNKAAYAEAARKLQVAHEFAFTEMAELAHEVGMAKVPYCIEYIKNMLENVGKVIVFANHHDVADALMEGLSEFNPVKLTGAMTNKDERQASVDSFQNNENVRVFIGTIKAAGVGLTLTAANTVVFCELLYRPSDIEQAEDRANRMGQTNRVLVTHLVLNGSIDAKMAHTLVDKMDVIDQALDKDTTIDVSHIRTTPIVPRGTRQETLPLKFPSVPETMKNIVHNGIRMLALRCDGAHAIDGAGFNKFDSYAGKGLAALPSLTDGAAFFAARLVQKYRKQLGGETGELAVTAKTILEMRSAAT